MSAFNSTNKVRFLWLYLHCSPIPLVSQSIGSRNPYFCCCSQMNSVTVLFSGPTPACNRTHTKLISWRTAIIAQTRVVTLGSPLGARTTKADARGGPVAPASASRCLSIARRLACSGLPARFVVSLLSTARLYLHCRRAPSNGTQHPH